MADIDPVTRLQVLNARFTYLNQLRVSVGQFFMLTVSVLTLAAVTLPRVEDDINPRNNRVGLYLVCHS